MNKHAFLIIAHHRMDILDILLEKIDDNRNDIYIHLDVKCNNKYSYNCKLSNVYLIDRKSINWGGYSQIDVALRLLQAATKNNRYKYYHLITGVTLPIKSMDYFHEFYDKLYGAEFIGFDNNGEFSDRVIYKHYYNEFGKPCEMNIFKYIFYIIFKLLLKLQKLCGYNNFKKFNIILKKGMAYWSITDNFARYLLSMKKLIFNIFRYSYCGDELFAQTIAYNSRFKNRLYNIFDEELGSMRYSPWEDNDGILKPKLLQLSDINNMIKLPYNFAFKFN